MGQQGTIKLSIQYGIESALGRYIDARLCGLVYLLYTNTYRYDFFANCVLSHMQMDLLYFFT